MHLDNFVCKFFTHLEIFQIVSKEDAVLSYQIVSKEDAVLSYQIVSKEDAVLSYQIVSKEDAVMSYQIVSKEDVILSYQIVLDRNYPNNSGKQDAWYFIHTLNLNGTEGILSILS